MCDERGVCVYVSFFSDLLCVATCGSVCVCVCVCERERERDRERQRETETETDRELPKVRCVLQCGVCMCVCVCVCVCVCSLRQGAGPRSPCYICPRQPHCSRFSIRITNKVTGFNDRKPAFERGVEK